MRVHESLRFTGSGLVQAITNCWFPSFLLSCKEKTALSMGRHLWAQSALGTDATFPVAREYFIWVTANQGFISRPVEAAGLHKPSPSLYPVASPSAGKTMLVNCYFVFRHQRSLSGHPAALPDALHFLSVQLIPPF